MAEQIHNIYINSTNKTGNDKNYDYKLYFSNYNIIPKTNAFDPSNRNYLLKKYQRRTRTGEALRCVPMTTSPKSHNLSL